MKKNTPLIIFLLLITVTGNSQESNLNEQLYIAVTERKDEEKLRSLLDQGADPNAISSQDGMTPLMRAAKYENEIAVKILLEYGADVNKPGAYGWTPLMLASQRGYIDIVVKLLRVNDICLDLKNDREESALMIAAKYGKRVLVELLVLSGAKIPPRSLMKERRVPPKIIKLIKEMKKRENPARWKQKILNKKSRTRVIHEHLLPFPSDIENIIIEMERGVRGRKSYQKKIEQ